MRKQGCFTRRVPGEGPAFCCKIDKVHIYIPEVPYELRRLFASLMDRDAKYFRKHIRYFNSHFSFTIFGVSTDQRLATAKGSGVYLVKERHMQLYFYDTDDSIDHRVKRSPNLDKNLIHLIRGVLWRYNPYVQWFTSLGTVTNIQEYTTELNISILVDQRRYNAPVMDDRDVQSRFIDAMTLVTCYGEPDYFVTMTCNPYWDEIMVELLPRQMPQYRPDVVARVYYAKLLDLHDFLIKKGHLGIVAAWAHGTEFQKRGLPHEHFLLVMEFGSKLKSPDDYDKYISAEIPDLNKYPRLHELVVKHMMHGPCGTLNKNFPCMKVKVRGEELDNRWVVPYNPVLLMRYNCHINVEICNIIKSVKYLYKYIYKGHDQTSFSVDAKGNEHRMQVHLLGMYMVAYKATNNLQDVVDHAKCQRSMLAKYFKMNERSAKACKYLYKEFPELFATIMVFCKCANIRHLWDKHYESLAEDFHRTNDNNTILVQLVLRDISFHLKSMGKDIRHYGLPELHESDDLRTRDHYRELTEEQNLGYEAEHLAIIDTLNAEQRAGFEDFFLDGPSGTGKTYLYKALLAKVLSMDLIAVAMATSGITTPIMPGGRTAHSRFKIPIKLDDSTMCSDFRQVLPIMARGTRAQITDATLLKSYIWESVRRIRLTQNMRAQSNMWFADYLLRISNGTEGTFGDEYVLLPDDIFIDSPSKDICIDTLIDHVFLDLPNNRRSAPYMRDRAILSTRNEHVDAVNALMIYSFDLVEDDTRNNYPVDFLNSITPNGLPPHELTIKKNYPVILLRNLDAHNGLFSHPICLSFAMTINKAQVQTITNVGIYLPEPVFAHGQLYIALSRGVSHETTWVLARKNKDMDPH
ncbi:hypothetical protein SETIT_8G102700v2 [Setaria italica]|uniref:ATP-dependent DNA helicase n=1 Tax=Setaria italica TaxID=4555 RepID=K3ZM90_SETIT|nr:hypothetical protein SETIT_8G102700v2 [Setaria italica]